MAQVVSPQQSAVAWATECAVAVGLVALLTALAVWA
jgi:hypothetical protein